MRKVLLLLFLQKKKIIPSISPTIPFQAHSTCIK